MAERVNDAKMSHQRPQLSASKSNLLQPAASRAAAAPASSLFPKRLKMAFCY